MAFLAWTKYFQATNFLYYSLQEASNESVKMTPTFNNEFELDQYAREYFLFYFKLFVFVWSHRNIKLTKIKT